MSQTKMCRYCGNILYDDDETCPFCGKYLLKPHDNPDLFCEKCKAPVNEDDNFCQRCGAIFNIPDDNSGSAHTRHNINEIPYNLGIFFKAIALSIAIAVFITRTNEFEFSGILITFIIALIVTEFLLYIYFLPSIIAIENNHKNICIIYFFNLFLGITVIGWLSTLIFALQSNKKF